MSAITWTERLQPRVSSLGVLRAATRFWLVAAVAGQWAFLYYIVAFYGPSTVTGNFAAWSRNTMLPKGYVAGDTIGNLAFAAHVLLAAVTSFGGALQLVPQIRARAMALHRWNGRLFLVTALAVSVTGLWMVWGRGTHSAGYAGSLGVSGNAVAIVVCAAFAWRTAVARDVASHRRWALRTYLVANGQWFFRVGMFGWILATRGAGMKGMFPLVWGFGCYLLPLAVLELWLRAPESGSRARLAMAGLLVVLTLLMIAGTFGVTMFMWRPTLARL